MIINKYNFKKIQKETEDKEHALSKNDQILVELKARDRRKSLPTVWAIWIALGIFGGHRFYMDKRGAPLMLCLTVIGGMCALDVLSYWMFGIGVAMLISAFIWKIVDACHMNRWVKFNHLRTKAEIIKEYEK